METIDLVLFITASTIFLGTLTAFNIYIPKLANGKWLTEERKYIYLLAPIKNRKNTSHPETTAMFKKAKHFANITTISVVAVFAALFATTIESELATAATIAASVGVLMWPLSFSAWTDSKTMLAPRETFTFALPSGFILTLIGVFGIVELEHMNWNSLYAWGGVWAVFLTLRLFGIGGMSDVRVMGLAFLTLGWWTPASYAGIALFISCVTALLMAGYYQFFKKPSEEERELKKRFQQRLFSAGKPPTVKIAVEAMQNGKATEGQISEWKAYNELRRGRYVDFIPHLLIGYVAIAFAALYF